MEETSRQVTSAPYLCRHCGNKGLLVVLVDHTVTEEHPTAGESWSTWTTARCPTCSGVSILHTAGTDDQVEAIVDAGDDPELELTEVLYPPAGDRIQGVPRAVSRALEAAERVKRIDPNAYAVLVGRVIERLCADRGARGDRLIDQIKDLEVRGEIPKKLVRVAHSLRRLRNAGAHPDLGSLSAREVDLLGDLCRALLEYVYTAPFLVQQAETHVRPQSLRRARMPRPEKIIELCARRYGLEVSELKSRSNAKKIVFPRQVAMYLCKQLTELSYPAIGRLFNDKHHSTVMHSVDKIERLQREDSDLRAMLQGMSKLLSAELESSIGTESLDG